MAGILTINTGNLKNSRSIKRRLRSKSVRVTNNRPASKFTRKGKVSIGVNRMKAKLLNNGSLRINGAPQSDNEVAEDIFKILGISPVYDHDINRADYSFIPTQTDIELVSNPNKMELGIFREITKGKVQFSNILKDTNNSFYKIDEGINQNILNELELIKKQDKTKNNFSEILAGLYHINYNMPSTKNLRALRK